MNIITSVDYKYMQRCFDLASLGLGQVQPNPMVGAVIVHKNKIIGEGWHRKYGEPHAEVNAIESVQDKTLLSNSVLYVNLEPCSHFGKTPPCADLIISYHIPKVVIATSDPNRKVAGNGIRKLQRAKIMVVDGVMPQEAVSLNKRFFTYQVKKRPYIILKWAQTADGFMDIDRENGILAEKYWITNQELRVLSHKLRNEEQAIVIGYNTYKNDNPQLTNRLYGSHQPRRYVIAHSNAPCVDSDNFTVLPSNLKSAMRILYEEKIQSCIIEGGKKTLQQFIDNDLWDEAIVMTGNQTWGKGLSAPILEQEPIRKILVGDNQVAFYSQFKPDEFKKYF